MLRRFWHWLGRQLIDDVPAPLSACVDCPRDPECTLEQAATCRLRIESELKARKGGAQ